MWVRHYSQGGCGGRLFEGAIPMDDEEEVFRAGDEEEDGFFLVF